jgi:hypothetical protein
VFGPDVGGVAFDVFAWVPHTGSFLKSPLSVKIAHEIAHVLGLGHVDTWRVQNLMLEVATGEDLSDLDLEPWQIREIEEWLRKVRLRGYHWLR